MDNYIKNRIIILIKFIGFGLNEILFEIVLPIGEFDSVEWEEDTNKVFLHKFTYDNFDSIIDFDDLDKENQFLLFEILSNFRN